MNATATPLPAALPSVWASKSTLFCLVAALVAYFLIVLPMMDSATNPLDEGLLLVYPELLNKGVLPQRDFESVYPPGAIWALAAAYKVTGADIYTERTVGMLYQALLICGLYCLLIPRGKITAFTGCLLSTMLLSRIGPAALAWMGALGFGSLCIAILTGPGDMRLRTIIAGVFSGLAVTWRLDMAPALLLAMGAYCVLSRCHWRDWVRLGVSGLAAIVPLIIHVFVAGPRAFFTNIYYDPVVRTHGARSLPLEYVGAYAVELYVLVVIGIAAAIAVGAAYRAEKSGLALFIAGLFALGLMPEGLQRGDSAHFTLVAVYAVPLLALAASIMLRNRIAPLYVAAAICFCVPQDVVFLRTIHTRDAGCLWVSNGSRQVTGSMEEQRAVDFLQSHALPGQRLFVGTQDMRYTIGNNVAFYHLFPQLRPATYFLEFEPHVANSPDSRLASDITTADWVVLDRTWQDTPEPNTSHVAGPDAPNQVVRKDFQLVFASGSFLVYKRAAS